MKNRMTMKEKDLVFLPISRKEKQFMVIRNFIAPKIITMTVQELV